MNLSARSELSELSEMLRPVATRASQLHIPWLLVGAVGRELLLHYIHGALPGRRTKDVDVAVQVATWEEYERLSDALAREDGARRDPAVVHRLFLGDGQIDLVPFGGVENHGQIRWPQDPDSVLGVRGLEEAYQQSTEVLLPGRLAVRVPSVESLVCLKLFAWKDRHLDRGRHDSVDLDSVLANAERWIDQDELYEEHDLALQRHGYDPTLAAIHVLGERLSRSLRSETKRELIAILERETLEEGRLALVRELGRRQSLPVLQALLQGLR